MIAPGHTSPSCRYHAVITMHMPSSCCTCHPHRTRAERRFSGGEASVLKANTCVHACVRPFPLPPPVQHMHTCTNIRVLCSTILSIRNFSYVRERALPSSLRGRQMTVHRIHDAHATHPCRSRMAMSMSSSQNSMECWRTAPSKDLLSHTQSHMHTHTHAHIHTHVRGRAEGHAG